MYITIFYDKSDGKEVKRSRHNVSDIKMARIIASNLRVAYEYESGRELDCMTFNEEDTFRKEVAFFEYEKALSNITEYVTDGRRYGEDCDCESKPYNVVYHDGYAFCFACGGYVRRSYDRHSREKAQELSPLSDVCFSCGYHHERLVSGCERCHTSFCS